MKRRYLIVLLLALTLLGLGCSSTPKKTGVFTTHFEDGTLKSVQSYNEGVLDGMSREYREIGTMKYITSYKDDKIDGMRNTYNPYSALWTKEIYEEGDIVGLQEFDQQGHILYETKFKKSNKWK